MNRSINRFVCTELSTKPTLRFLTFVVVVAAVVVSTFAVPVTAGEVEPKDGEGVVSPGFLPQLVVPLSGTGHPSSVILSDFNGDGILDIAVTDMSPDTFDYVHVLLGVGDGSFGPLSTNGIGSTPTKLVSVDINLDGNLDIVTSNRDTNDVSVLRGNGDGTFLPEEFFFVGSDPESVAVADVDNDGLPDIITANMDADTVSVLLGDGTGLAFARTDFTTLNLGGTSGSTPVDLVVMDLNNDSFADIAALAQGDNQVALLYNTGAGGFFTGDFAIFAATGTIPKQIEAVDADGDGWLDLAVTNLNDDSVVVLRNNVDAFFPTFSPGPPIPVFDGAGGLAVGDFDLDGLDDLAAAGGISDDLHVLRGDGLGSFSPAGTNPVQESPVDVAIGDLDRDGDPDIVVANFQSDTVSILLNTFNIVFGPPPVARIDAPTAHECLCGSDSVIGVAHVDLSLLDHWTLEYRLTSGDSWTLLVDSGTDVPEPGGPLTTWNNAALAEGRYLLKLTVHSLSGLSATDEVVVWVSRDFDAADFDFLWGNVGMPSVASFVAGNACPIGTVLDNGCGEVTYTIDYQPSGGGAYTPIDPGMPSYLGGKINSPLGSWDTIATAVPDGAYSVRVVGTNACGQQQMAVRSVSVDNTPPVAGLTAPVSCTVFHPNDLVEIRGTASDANLVGWSLSIIGGPHTNWHTLASGSSSVVDGLLATWDTSGLPECGYVLRLRVTDAAIPNCGSSRRDVIVYRAFGLGVNGCMFTDGVEIGATDHWTITLPE